MTSRLPHDGAAKSVIPAETGIQLALTLVDPRLRGDDMVGALLEAAGQMGWDFRAGYSGFFAKIWL